jgi:hypothetical protein
MARGAPKFGAVLVPKLVTVLKDYSREKFAGDLVAGVIVGVVALSLAIAFAIASGVTPDRGLWTAIVAGFLISLLGGSMVQIEIAVIIFSGEIKDLFGLQMGAVPADFIGKWLAYQRVSTAPSVPAFVARGDYRPRGAGIHDRYPRRNRVAAFCENVFSNLDDALQRARDLLASPLTPRRIEAIAN